jgi:Tol biopolymer transport system component
LTPEQWHRVKEVFEAALGHAPEERAAFLDQACAGDDLLCKEVESLLSSYEQESSFLETPAAALAAQSLVKEESAALVGQQLGHYKIVREIGRGGMGVVYLAQDVSLGRPVALKLLPKHLTSDPNRLRRFEREARAASALNHHNILTIYEIAHLEGLHLIATEFIDGVTLRERIKSKELQLSEALTIAEQIASALVAAHNAGIVHRDIKPENVMLRRDGYVKVLDFGLAKLTEQEMVKSVSASAAIDGTKTDTGVMGTAGYMSPEQARGDSVDHRTDIFSLGVVIYEMVTGQMPFEAKKATDVIAAIPEQEPLPLAHYLPEAPPELQLIVNKALRTNKEERYQTIAELLLDLRRVRSRRPSRNFTRRLILLAATFALMVGGLLWFYGPRQIVKSSLPPMKVVPFTSFAGSEWLGAFSPDGNQITFAWTGKEDNLLGDIYVKQIGVENPVRLTTSHSQNMCPVWTPDGQKVAFVRYSETGAATIFTVPASGGAERKLLDLGSNAAFCGWDWSPDGKFIAFAQKDPKEGPFRIFLVSADTLAKSALTSPPGGNLADLNWGKGDFDPEFSPDGQSVAFVRYSSWISGDIYIVAVGGGEPRRLTFNNTTIAGLAWTADGREIIFSQNPVFVEGNGSLWRIPASGGTAERFAEGGHNAVYPHIARRGNRLAFVQGSGDLSIYRKELSATSSKLPPTKFIASTRNDASPDYSPDGSKVVFHSDRSGQFEIWKCDSDGTNAVQLTFLNKFAGSPRWSPDGQQIAFDFFGERRGQVYVVSAERDQPRPITSGDFDNIAPSWSRNGRWIYFASNRTGAYQVWKVPAEGGEAVQVTRQGGFGPLESPDGEFIYYVKTFPTTGIWRIPVNGGDELQIVDSFKSEFKTDWAVVENGIYFVNIDAKPGVAIEFFDFATSKVRRIAKGKLHYHSYHMAVSPDRREILYSQLDNVGEDIMLVENFR